MKEVLFNNKGVPLVGFGNEVFFSTTGGPNTKIQSKPVMFTPKNTDDDERVESGYKIMEWGDDNEFPETALTQIGKNTVLASGLKYKLQLLMGQGIFPAKVTGFDNSGNEVLEVVNNSDITNLVKSRMIRRYLQNTARDVFKLGNGFPVLRFTPDGKKIPTVQVINARTCRWEYSSKGFPEYCIISDWRDSKDYMRLPVLNIEEPEAHLEDLMMLGKTKNLNIIYPINNYFSNNFWYAEPDWWVAYNAGWLDISSKVPSFLKKVYDNQITWKWHVQIPYSYWDKRYPKNKFKNDKDRQDLITAEMTTIENNLIGTDNANKTLFTHYTIGLNGKPEEEWIIKPLDNKYKSDQQMVESAVADSNILFSMNINPTLMGAGMPGSGPHANSQGGSNIREAFLVNIAMSWLDRQNILDPLEIILKINFDEDVELRFRNTILTTLDTGSGTSKVIS